MNIIEVAYKWHVGFTKRSRTDFIALHHAEAVKCTPQDVYTVGTSQMVGQASVIISCACDGIPYRGQSALMWLVLTFKV